jgi:hypothetical protein
MYVERLRDFRSVVYDFTTYIRYSFIDEEHQM